MTKEVQCISILMGSKVLKPKELELLLGELLHRWVVYIGTDSGKTVLQYLLQLNVYILSLNIKTPGFMSGSSECLCLPKTHARI